MLQPRNRRSASENFVNGLRADDSSVQTSCPADQTRQPNPMSSQNARPSDRSWNAVRPQSREQRTARQYWSQSLPSLGLHSRERRELEREQHGQQHHTRDDPPRGNGHGETRIGGRPQSNRSSDAPGP